jgi:ribosome-associated protein
MEGSSQEIKQPVGSAGRTGESSPPNAGDVRAICALLEEHKGENVTALDLRKLHCWTDFFIIATVTSTTHLQGLLRHIKDFAAEQNLIRQPKSKVTAGIGGNRATASSGGNQATGGSQDDWDIVDMGTALIHLMSARTREFYELEELWGSAERIYP